MQLELYGPQGQGLIAELRERQELSQQQIETRIPVRVGTLSKALGTQGGFVAGSAELIQLLWNTARTVMFTTGLSIPACAAASRAIELLQQDAASVVELRQLACEFRQKLIAQNFDLLGAPTARSCRSC